MPELETLPVIGGAWGALGADVRALSVVDTALGPVVVAVSGTTGGVVTFDLSGARIDATYHGAGVKVALGGVRVGALPVLDLDAGRVAVTGVDGAGRLVGYDIDADGGIGAATTLGIVAGPVALTQHGQTLYGMSDDAVLAWLSPGGSGYVTRGELVDRPDIYLADARALGTLTSEGKTYLMALSGEGGVTSFEMDGTGALRVAGAFGRWEGLGLHAVAIDMEVVQVAGQSYAVVASGASDGGAGGALSVIGLGPGGQPVYADHVLDGGATRFGDAVSMTTAAAGDWTFVAAAGGEGGVSLFTMLPNGRLVHLDTVGGEAAPGLSGITNIAAAVVDDALHVLVARQTQGIAHLSHDLADLGVVLHAASGRLDGTAGRDMLAGGSGANDLRGGAGADILFDGGGADTVFGGAGADLFLFGRDDATDVIRDFEPGVDRVDLSLVPMLYSAARLSVTPMSWGARIELPGGEVLDLYSASGKKLSVAQVQASLVWDTDRPPFAETNDDPIPEDPDDGPGPGGDPDPGEGPDPGGDPDPGGIPGGGGSPGGGGNPGGGGDPDPPPPTRIPLDPVRVLIGGSGADRLIGGDNDDLLDGKSGRDVLEGNAGNDTLYGRGGWDRLDGGDHDDILHGNQGQDTLFGGAGNDTINGGMHDDTIHGNDGDDLVDGGAGRDLVYLGLGDDIFIDTDQAGVAGRDTVFGGGGRDVIRGSAGDDLFHGNSGDDTIHGGAGADTVYGGVHADLIHGEDGADLVFGGPGPDSAWLGRGDDVFRDNGQDNDLGRDTVHGGNGRDTIFGGGGRDVFDGGAGDDVIHGGLNHDLVMGGAHADRLYGQAGNDTIIGGPGRDQAWLGGGDDTFLDEAQGGFLGGDLVFGRAGNDTIWAGGGNDTLQGDAGADTFVFFGSAIGADRVTDYRNGIDRLQLDDALWSGTRDAQGVVDAFARVQGGGTLFDFGAAGTIRLDGVTSLAGLADDISIF
ncbi:hypothetical protein [Pseudooceanicola sp. LIPI14-2-Ac024]|uniref:hypothetical protein n=1 Tax=Pseudooceanicola sp. LIPI14-2-Ac024 TaxID=3344875 RepID=UPI0035CFBAFA